MCVLALAAFFALAARAEPLPARGRKLINLQTANTRYFHQPLVNCQNYTLINASTILGTLPTVSAPCCTLTALECATRCDALPGCLGFKFAWRVDAHAALTPGVC